MAILNIPDQNKTVKNTSEIKSFLKEAGIQYEVWQTNIKFSADTSQDKILKAFQNKLKPFMEKGGYSTADVISVNSNTENLSAIREKFLREHTHTEDEVRYFIDGSGLFWFNLENKPVFSVLCEKGDLISVPENSKHWFDLGKEPYVKAIRIFTDISGWVPNYTDSGIDEQYNLQYA